MEVQGWQDFPYDDDPMPDMLADERNLFFPLEKAAGLEPKSEVPISPTPSTVSLQHLNGWPKRGHRIPCGAVYIHIHAHLHTHSV